MRMICQLCNEHIGEVSIEGAPGIEPLRYPFKGAMVGSPDPAHGIPPPFEPTVDWEFARCVYGRIHRPMVEDDKVLTDEGVVVMPKDGSPAYPDPGLTGSVDRQGLSDRTIMVSDEEAGRMAREELAAATEIHNTPSAIVRNIKEKAARATIAEFEGELSFDKRKAGEAIPIDGVRAAQDGRVFFYAKNESAFPCPVCKKEFPTEKAMTSHKGGAHRKGRR